mmetsp:Transcript_66725/g.215717  ORF Transcript_66725/g.215717 Transcript_66725/m.215717 type:complete len:252 (+) Transcript_66725:1725-2480(+)
MGDHDSLRVACRAGGVDQPSAVAGLDNAGPQIQIVVRCLTLAELKHGLPTHHRNSADSPHGDSLTVLGLEAIRHDGLQMLAVIACGQCVGNLLDLASVFQHNDGTLRVHNLVCSGLCCVSGIETRTLRARERRRDGRHVPLRRVEAPNVDRLELPNAQAYESLGRLPHVLVVLFVCPSRPLLTRKRCRDRLLDDSRHGPLDEQRGPVALFLGAALQQRNQRRRRRLRGAGHARGRAAGLDLSVRLAGKPRL